jgi:CheY-like chemotaxis protein
MAKTILLVEDYEDDAVALAKLLKEAKPENHIHRVSDGAEAIAYLQGEGLYANRQSFPLPNILLLDLKMPGKSGFEVLEWIKTQPRFHNMLLVVLSGYNELKDVQRAYSLGADTFLTKPCKEEDIRSLIKNSPFDW